MNSTLHKIGIRENNGYKLQKRSKYIGKSMESKHFKFLSIGSRYLSTNNYIIDNSLHTVMQIMKINMHIAWMT